MAEEAVSGWAESECEHAVSAGCGGRREFLARALTGAGGLVLALSIAGCGGQSEEQGPEGGPPDRREGRRPGGPGGGQRGGPEGGGPVAAATVQGDEVVLKLDAGSPLQNVGGSQTVETPAGRIVVARTGESSFVAVSAVCPHKNGPINYDAAQKQFHCPKHNSRFALDGAVLNPPARNPLQVYAPRADAASNAVTISLKPKA